ncbi:MAG: MATE family efflux transporter [Clostridia bacterium]|nr:MATE family efflux transporter [Clostridia bacterium]
MVLPLKHIAKGNTTLILHGSLLRAMLSIAVPVVINSFLQTLYNLTDTYWLGQLGTAELAAINLVSPVQSIVISFGSGVTVAGAVMIAQYIGAQKPQSALRIANHIFSVAMIFSLVCAVLLTLLTPGIVAWLGAQDATFTNAVTYLRLVILDMPFLFMVNIYQAIRQAQGDTVRPMLLNLLGITLNLVLDPLLMVVLHFGAAGAALATVMAKAVPALCALSILLRRRDEPVYLDRRLMKPDRESLSSIVRIGLPTALGGSVMQLGFLLMSRNVMAYGEQAVAAYGIGNKVNGLISLPSNGIGSAVSTIVGQNMGAKQTERARRGYLLSMACAVVFLFLGGRILSLSSVATAIVSIFSTDAAVITMAADFLSTMAFWCFTNGIHDATCGLFQGSGHTEVPMAVNVTRLWVLRFATLYVCETLLGLGVQSIWYSVVVSNGISAAALLVLYFTGLWKKSRVKV